jgi:uncharacterized BrkB/YihY/UPF0761 family membrane protein
MPPPSAQRAHHVESQEVGTMPELSRKLHIVVLWISLAVGTVASLLLYLAEPGNLQDALQGRIEGETINAGQLILFASFILLPLLMAYLTLVLPPAVNKWGNLVLGTGFTAFVAIDFFSSLGGYFGGQAFIMVFGIVAGALLFWEAWRWPITTAAAPPTIRRERHAVH